MCEVLEVSRSGFYKWRKRVPTKLKSENATLLEFLLKTAKEEHEIPGYRKLWRAAVDDGFICGLNKVQKMLQTAGYRSCIALSPGYRKLSKGLPILPNLLNREFDVKEANRVWVSDITQIRCDEGWLYIAIILDLYSRSVIGWAASPMNNAELVEEALENAWKLK